MPLRAPKSGCPSDQVAWGSEDTTYALYRKECSGNDYEAPLDAEQGGGRLEFTCLPPKRDTMWTAWVVPLARGDLTVHNLLT